MTRYKDAQGVWRAIGRSTFAGWYTRPFADDIVERYEQEFALEDQLPERKPVVHKRVRFRLPNRTLAVKDRTPRTRMSTLPTQIFQCEHWQQFQLDRLQAHPHDPETPQAV